MGRRRPRGADIVAFAMFGLRACLLLLAAIAALAAATPAQAQDPGVRVYDVVIDGLDPAWVTPANAPTISALLDDPGTTSYAAARAIMASETNPNHVAAMTGAYAATSGFVGNAWFDRASGRQTAGEDAANLRAETLFTAVERQRPELVTAAVFGKPKLARIFADGGSNVAPDHLWLPCRPGQEPPGATCGDVPTNPASGYAFDDAVIDETIRTIDALDPHVTFVNLADVDSAGHGFTPLAPVYLAAIARADLLLARLIDHLKQTGRWERAVLIVHADHGMNATPVRVHLTTALRAAGISGLDVTSNGGLANATLLDPARPDAADVLARARRVALAQPGVDEALYRAPNQLDPSTPAAPTTLADAHPAWHYGNERAGDLVVTADPEAVFSDPSPQFQFNPLPGNHGHPSARAIPFVVTGGSPLLGPGGRVEPSGAIDEGDDTERNPGQAENVDVAPTIAALLGLAAPAQSEGRVLSEALALP
jgi:ectonucleotide pyrophosphatase/phosphodiesterase family member 5